MNDAISLIACKYFSMRMMWKKWGIVLKALGICAILLVLRVVVDALNLDVITVNTRRA
jgi:hypothetical protein